MSGHNDEPMNRQDFEEQLEIVRQAEDLVGQIDLRGLMDREGIQLALDSLINELEAAADDIQGTIDEFDEVDYRDSMRPDE